METKMDDKRKKGRRINILLLLLLAAVPVLSGFSLWLVTGYSPLHMDMWKTAWNDEVVYYRAIRLLRLYVFPQGVAGYNEVAARQLTYGAYNIFTFLPYWAVSFITGTAGHNFFCLENLILAAAANFFFALAAKPDVRRGILTALFFMTNLILARYTWSGMIETSYNFYMIVFTGLLIGLFRKKTSETKSTAAVLILMMAMTFFWTVMRPFYVVFLLIPLFYIWRKKEDGAGFSLGSRIVLTLLDAAAGAGGFLLFAYFGNNSVAHYFADAPSPTGTLRELLGSGSVSYIVKYTLQANIEALRVVKNNLLSYSWIGAVSLLFYVEWILLFVLFVKTVRMCSKGSPKWGGGRAFSLFAMLLAGAMIYEATVVLYAPIQLHRMMLAVTVGYALLIIELGELTTTLNEVVLLVLMAFLVIGKPSSYLVPQADPAVLTETGRAEAAKAEEALEAELERLLPLREEPWENTVAKEPEGSGLEYEFLMPVYSAFNICQRNVLVEKIRTGTLQSRYVILAADSDLNTLCSQKLQKIWEGYGHILYKR